MGKRLAEDVVENGRACRRHQAHEYQKYAAVLDQMFRLRKKVFADKLGWDVPVIGPYERDSYDSLAHAYLVWCNDSRT
ncbi:acyl-homoserine-lactone synthase, partial [Rhizobium ruizarguesonis]